MRSMASVILFAALAVVPAKADPLPQKSDQVVQYQIAVSLDPAKKQLQGTERLTWRNPSTTDTVGELRFHLYLNAFKNTKTTFVKESGGQLRGDEMAENAWGWIDVTSLKTAAGADLKAGLTFIQPDDGNNDDQTVASVVLPEPVPPGGSITLDIVFTAQLPQVFARTGYKDDFFLVGQWFPKIGVYEPAGMRGQTQGGWNCHQFHANSEFYADYGSFRVEITIPSNYVMGATGVRTNQRTNPGGTTTYVYEQADVHDFAWTADPDYVVITAKFSATEDVSPAEYARIAKLLGRSLDEVKLSDVDITVLLQPDHRPQAQRHVDAAKAGLKWFGLWYGRYPYKTLTVVDPAPGGGGAGGMEYPTFITAGSSWLLNYWPFDKLHSAEAVTIHEFGHQFWYAMVGNNEFEEAWLDEGFNTYSTAKTMTAVFGRDRTMLEFLGISLGEWDVNRLSNSPTLKYNRILQNSWSYVPPGTYGFYSYQKPALVLGTLEGYIGEEMMARIMRTYHERWRFKHPRSEDFFALVNELTGQDFGWYFDQVVRGGDVLDYDISSATTRPVRADSGVFDGPGGRKTVSEEAAHKQTEDAVKAKTAQYETSVVVRRRGEVYFPVTVAFKFEGKPEVRMTWDGVARTNTFKFVRPEKLEWADVDPDRKVLLDVNWLNNGRRIEDDLKPSASWTSRWLFLVQNIVTTLGLF
ncbi:MAG: M1 family metallopeptidase [Acidobacteria bacterium]|nr:M1 family metallopeptidase [Acidobacteriota bacterium]